PANPTAMAAVSFLPGLTWSSATSSAPHEIHHLLKRDRAVSIRIHRPKDFLVSRLPLLERNRPIAIGIHQSKNHPHQYRVHHVAMVNPMAAHHPRLAHHPAHHHP